MLKHEKHSQFSEAEIAREEKVSQVAIHKSISDARNKLKEILKIRL